jgi:hypothetical protein
MQKQMHAAELFAGGLSILECVLPLRACFFVGNQKALEVLERPCYMTSDNCIVIC